ncbi:uncharacterized protein LOC119289377 isoform X2 [Triticum dicoccoides]|uniref:uncharacterized protein LOC119289377 isoform X2 n=1 Tax=Triticum dicoccoides TaxID=85692 RepID=UPI00188FCD89|nr:uncharacterized protein LOC119289377 isoform X2 [Triticum dicoccoides]
MAATRACLLALVVALTFVFMEGRMTAAPSSAGSLVQRRREVRSLLRRLNKPPVASIQSSDGDVIDCVHISKQPAFDHPLLKNHNIQMRPSYNPRGMHHDSNITAHAITQIWHQNGTCPENTIPIRRTKEEDVLRANSIRRFGKKMPRSIPHLNPTNDTDTPNVLRGHQHAVASAQYDKCYGTKSTFNLWKPWIARGNDFSLTQFWITGGSYNGNSLNTIEVGWQDRAGGNWWLQVGGDYVGYWPSSIFSYLEDSASTIMWGGEVFSPDAGQTSTHMGSGHFPNEGFGKASHIKNIQVVDSSNCLNPPSNVGLITEQNNCYNVQSDTYGDWGTYIYYGGPGSNHNCP